MDQPEPFKVEVIAPMQALMRARPLATLVSPGHLGLFATLLPTVLKTEGARDLPTGRADGGWCRQSVPPEGAPRGSPAATPSVVQRAAQSCSSSAVHGGPDATPARRVPIDLAELLNSLPRLGDDADDFERDIREARQLLPSRTEPWES